MQQHAEDRAEFRGFVQQHAEDRAEFRSFVQQHAEDRAEFRDRMDALTTRVTETERVAAAAAPSSAQFTGAYFQPRPLAAADPFTSSGSDHGNEAEESAVFPPRAARRSQVRAVRTSPGENEESSAPLFPPPPPPAFTEGQPNAPAPAQLTPLEVPAEEPPALLGAPCSSSSSKRAPAQSSPKAKAKARAAPAAPATPPPKKIPAAEGLMTAAFGNDSHGDLRHQPQRKLAAAGATDAPTRAAVATLAGESKASPRARVAPSAAEDSAEKSGRKRGAVPAPAPDTVTPRSARGSASGTQP
eukprot:gene9903-biopygen6802